MGPAGIFNDTLVIFVDLVFLRQYIVKRRECGWLD